MAAKFKEYYKEMMRVHKPLFDAFKEIHDNYMDNPDEYQSQFNTEGEKIMEIVREYDRRLCAHSEGGQYGKYANNLSDKFWGEVRKEFPKIDFIGATIS